MHRIGDTLDDRYRLSRPLGMRQGAEMWEADHQVTGRKVTLEIMSAEVSGDAIVRRRLVCEARAAAEIAHPSVVEIYDVGVTPDGIAYLVSETLHGEVLADIISRHGAMQAEDACQVMLQILAGLEAAHAGDIVHGDLRSESVILRRGRSGQLVVKLLDFGVSTSSQQTMTAPPASSSRAMGRAAIDVTADLQSSGAVLFEMLSGRSAAQRAGAAQGNGHAAPTALSLVPAIPAGLARIVDNAMSQAAVRSVVSAKEMAGMIAPFAVSERPPSLAPRDTLMPFLSPEARKSRGMARLERAVLGASARPNLVVIEGASAKPFGGVQASRSPIAYEGSVRAPGSDSARVLNPEDLLEPRIPKAPRAPRSLAHHLPRSSRPARVDQGPRPSKRSSLPLRKWKAAKQTASAPTRSERQALAASPTPPPLEKGSLAARLWSAGLLAVAGLGAGLLLARLLHL